MQEARNWDMLVGKQLMDPLSSQAYRPFDILRAPQVKLFDGKIAK